MSMRVLSMARIASVSPEWAYYLGAVLLALGVFGLIWVLIKLFR